MTFTDYAPLYDFSQWEKAIQAFFVASGAFASPPPNTDKTRETWLPATGKTPFYIGDQSQVFQNVRPYVSLGTIDYQERQETRVVDADGRLRRPAWNTPLEFNVITKADYATHSAMLASVRSLINMMNPAGVDPATGLSDQSRIATTGLNPFLVNHELAKVMDAGGPTLGGRWTVDSGYFVTPLKFNATFSVQVNKWPGGILNA